MKPLFLRDAWYMAGWSSELGATPLSRRLFDRQVARLCPAEASEMVGGADRHTRITGHQWV